MPRRLQLGLILESRRITLGARTIIMGVLNVTPDSFSDGGRFFDSRRAIRHAIEMARQGADWIDVGGESTRPGAQPVSPEEELRRVLPVIRGVRRSLPGLPVSIDTTKAIVAEEAIHAGASIVNDVSGLRFDPGIAEVARRFRTPLVLMHLRGRPASMQRKPFVRSIHWSLACGLSVSIRRALSLGIPRSQLILDPGLGFGKTRRQNFEILAHLNRLQRFRLPLLVGASRKSFIQAVVAGEGLEPGKSKTTDYWKLTGSQRTPLAAERPRQHLNRKPEFPWPLD
ncbi:MAG TPA: dihydropteroate synthase, partial [Terriglobia bacterium]|nr:dihydropteroate synthase [Terriglobia bacterium]